MTLASNAILARSPTARTVVHAFDPGGNHPKNIESQLRSDGIGNPAEWWDKRKEKTSSNHSDFGRKKNVLWQDSHPKPAWVDSQLALLEPHACSADGGARELACNANELAYSESHGIHAEEGESASKNATKTSNISSSEIHENLWKDLFSNPTQWWDNRAEKRSPKHPDFRNKSTGMVLWLDSYRKPSWVDQNLLSVYDQNRAALETGAHISTEAEVRREEREPELWKDLIRNPSAWWDNRSDKKNDRQPDFRHRSSGEVLWLDSRRKPSWVDFQLATFNAYHRNAQYSTADDEIQNLCNEGKLDSALDFLSSMDQLGFIPSEKSFLFLLRACKLVKASTQTKLVHSFLVRHQVNLDGFLGQHLLFTLAKCGVFDDAHQVFCGLSKRSVITWTTMISVYITAGREEEALELYKGMQEEGVGPDAYTFVKLLKACSNLNDLLLGKKLHGDILKYKCNTDVYVGAGLIEMFAKCGSLVDAQMVFDGLIHRDVVSWTVLLSAYIEYAGPKKALALYDKMKEDGVSPDTRTMVVVLQAYGFLMEEEGHADEGGGLQVRRDFLGDTLYSEAVMLGFDLDSYVGNTVISMYGKSGRVSEAECVFQRSERTVVSWTAMMSVYAEQGHAEMVVNGYRQMKLDGLIPSEWTYVAALRACCVLAGQEEERAAVTSDHEEISLTFGKELHEEARKHGFDKDVYVGTSLLTMYSICGDLSQAEMVFEGMPVHNTASYNALLSAYVDLGQGEKFQWLYKQMQMEGVHLNDRTFVLALQACCMPADMEETFCGQQASKVNCLKDCLELHMEAWKRGLDASQYLVSAMVNAYSKWGACMEAESVFKGFSEHDIVSWNGMLTAYVEQGNGEAVLQLYKQMQEKDIIPDAITLLCVLQACGEVRNLAVCEQIHFSIVSENYDSDLYLAKALIRAYGCCGSVFDAHAVFSAVHLKSTVLWNALIAVYAAASNQTHGDNGGELRITLAKKALQLCQEMEAKGSSLNEQTIIHALQACCSLARAEKAPAEDGGATGMGLGYGLLWHSEILKRGLESIIVLGSALVSMYGKHGRILEAEKVFEGMASQGDLVSWNAMMSVYAEDGKGEKVLQLYRKMQEKDVVAADWMLICVLQACISTGDIEMCRKIHREIVLAGFDTNLAMANTLMNVYGSCASVAETQAIFDTLEPNVVSWTALIAAYVRQGDYAASLKLYEKMRQDGFTPNEVTFLSVLSACNHGGFVDKAYKYLASMKTECGLAPDIEHYGIMLDLLGRAGDFVGVKNLLSEMPMEPDLEMWLCLLGSCQKHGNVDLGKKAFSCAMRLQSKHAGAHVLMSNIVADTASESSVQKADKQQRSGLRGKYDKRWIGHEQAVPVLWQEMANCI